MFGSREGEIYLYDKNFDKTERISWLYIGGEGSSGGCNPIMDDYGRKIGWLSSSNGIVPGDINGKPDLFIYDTATKKVTLESILPGGRALAAYTLVESAAISPDGNFVVFVAADSNASQKNLYIRNLSTGETRVVMPPNPLPASYTYVQPSFGAGSKFVMARLQYHFTENQVQKTVSDILVISSDMHQESLPPTRSRMPYDEASVEASLVHACGQEYLSTCAGGDMACVTAQLHTLWEEGVLLYQHYDTFMNECREAKPPVCEPNVVEKIVEVEKVVEVEKIVEVQKLVEVEKIVEVEKVVEKLVPYPVERIVERETERTIRTCAPKGSAQIEQYEGRVASTGLQKVGTIAFDLGTGEVEVRSEAGVRGDSTTSESIPFTLTYDGEVKRFRLNAGAQTAEAYLLSAGNSLSEILLQFHSRAHAALVMKDVVLNGQTLNLNIEAKPGAESLLIREAELEKGFQLSGTLQIERRSSGTANVEVQFAVGHSDCFGPAADITFTREGAETPPIETIVEKIIEKPVERVITVEVPVERIVEKTVYVNKPVPCVEKRGTGKPRLPLCSTVKQKSSVKN